MSHTCFRLTLGLMCTLSAVVRGADVWVPDQGDGTFRNPVVHADYSDPDVVRFGDGYYMTASSFGSVPALPILFSRDLVNWTIVGHALDRLPSPVFDTPQHGKGVWAPAMRVHDGWVWIYWGDPDFGIFMTKARKPEGPWSAPVHVKQAKGWIDPCPFWDEDGSAYLVHAWAGSRVGFKSLLTVNRMSPDGERILDGGTTVLDGRVKHPTIEGPKFYKRNGYYYIFAPGGGVTQGWQTVLRGRSPLGPYEDRIVLAQGSTKVNGPHQGGWVETPTGQSWFVHFQDRDAYGRIVHLQPMVWKDDWPVMGHDPDGDGTGEPVLTAKKPEGVAASPVINPQTSDDFSAERLGLQWQWHANPKDGWGTLSARKGFLRLASVPMPAAGRNLWDVPSLLLQKLPAPEFEVTALVDFGPKTDGERAGLLIMGADYAYLAVERKDGRLLLVQRSATGADNGSAEVEHASAKAVGPVHLRVSVADGAVCRFSYSRDGKAFQPLGSALKAKPGRWIGAKVGLFALAPAGATAAGHADIDGFRFDAAGKR